MFFSGFCLENEKELFSEYLIENDYTLSGFSYGAIEAFEFAYNSVAMDIRVDLVQLFSPAFFNTKDEKYKRLQLLHFKKDPTTYTQNFLKNCGFDQNWTNRYFKMGTYDQLERLLNYKWDKTKLKQLQQSGVKIEVYIGSEDKIVDPQEVLNFFVDCSEVYLIKNKGHIL